MIQIQALLAIYREAGSEDYIGEPISQLEHAQQAALLARKAGANSDVVLAAFFHDIGHLCAPLNAAEMDGLGVLNHESIGAEFLRKHGLRGMVPDLVELHVQAKRYLCCRNQIYRSRLSAASRGTLAFQGGVMTEAEAEDFESHPLFRDILRLRAWDEAAKEPNGEGLTLAKVEQLLNHYGA